MLDQNLEIPHNIHVISWNYDSQFEIAYKEYSKEKELPVASKKHLLADKAYKIIKVNGTASFDNISDIRALREEYPRLTNMARGEDYIDATRTRYILDLYKKFKTEAGATQLSFAFDGRQEKSLYNAVDRIIEYTDVLVVIGYTFPFFNREIDRRLLRRFGSASTIYIQDIYPERIKQSIKAVLPRFPESHIVPLTDVEQFFLPPEL